MDFDIRDGYTLVENRLVVERSEVALDRTLILDGQDLELVSVAVDGVALGSNEYQLDADSLTLVNLPDACEVVVVTRIEPEQNSALEGLYKSGSMYCTQCEAEGFRKITYYQDRPDVLSV
ncbi:MAG: aminopeptidase N, partial [Pseudomonadales bacterium]